MIVNVCLHNDHMHITTGRDGTKAFSTGEFNDAGLTDDLSGVETSHFGEYENWVKFFDKDYKYIGEETSIY